MRGSDRSQNSPGGLDRTGGSSRKSAPPGENGESGGESRKGGRGAGEREVENGGERIELLYVVIISERNHRRNT